MLRRPFSRIFPTACVVFLMSAGVAIACSCGGGGGGSPSGCITTLPVNVQFQTEFAPAYKHSISIVVVSQGPPIRNLTATLYTFSGVELGASKTFRKTIYSSNTIRLKLRYPLQAGSFTLALFGEPNANPSCGPKHVYKVVHFLPCLTTLPVSFPNPPGGSASAYSGSTSLSVNVASTSGQLLQNVSVSLYDFNGVSYGTQFFKVLYGQETATFNLPNGVQPPGYTVIVSGGVKGMPASCGQKKAQIALNFK